MGKTQHAVRRACLGLAVATLAVGSLVPVASANPNSEFIQYDGQSGEAVGCIQFALKYCASHDVDIDFVYGPQTRQGVYDVQRFFGIAQDGVVGPQTGDAFVVIADNCKDPQFLSVWGACPTLIPTTRTYD